MNDTAEVSDAPAHDPVGAKTAKGSKAAVATTPESTPAPAKQVKHLPRSSLNLLEVTNNAWNIVAAPGTTAADYDLQAGPFELIASELTRFDQIRMPSSDGTWWAELVVVDTGPGYALCRVLKAINLPTRLSDMSDRVPAGFDIVQANPGDEQGGWHILRQSDGVMLNGGHILHRREDATRFLLDHSSVRGDSVTSIWRGQT